MYVLIVILLLAAFSCVSGQHGHGSHNQPEKKPVSLDAGLGNVDHPVTTKNPEAQKFFNQGLAYLYGFNHAEGINSFKHAAQLDPEMAMAQWGISLALGSNYNVTADAQQLTDAFAALQKAIELAPKASAADQAYITALTRRYAKDPTTDRKKLAADYKTAMGELVKQYPDDLDAATLYAESMMNLRPWQLWSLDGKPAEGTLEIVAVLEGVLRRNPRHTGANHYYIHAIEASPTPERGMAAAMRLGGLAPNAGHLVHMPSHIYLRTGDFDEAVKSNDLAIVADRNYIQKSGAQGVYPLMYYNHNIHMLAASHVGNGNYAGALKAARDLEANVGPNVAAMPMLEMFMPYHLVTLIRFHRSDEIMKYQQPPAAMKLTNGFWRLARGLALSDTGNPADAEKELVELRALVKTIPADAGLGNSTAHGVFGAAAEMLSGEIALAKGDKTAAVESLKRAVAAEDLVNYNEPPDFDIPVREWLGRAYLRSGKFAEAEAVYRDETVKHPRNGRALFGLAEALKKQGKSSSADLVRREFEKAWANSDTKLAVAELYGSTASSPAAASSSRVKLRSGVALNYRETGDPSGPVIILIHGYTDSSYSYSRVQSLIDKRFRILAIDQRGHGDSDKPESGYSMKDFAGDVAAFMDAKGIDKATIVGHSMGSFVAMQTALDIPERVARLVLIGTASTANNKTIAELRTVIEQMKGPVTPEFAREFQVGTSSSDLPAEFIETVVGESLKVPLHVWRSALAGVMARDYKPDLGRIKVPVTIFWGEKETIFPRAEQDILKANLNNATLKIYPNSGHAPHWEEPQKFASDLNAILARR